MLKTIIKKEITPTNDFSFMLFLSLINSFQNPIIILFFIALLSGILNTHDCSYYRKCVSQKNAKHI